MGTCLSADNANCCIDILETSTVQKIQPVCPQISLVLRKIFQHFSSKELLGLSLVSKLWNSEARSLLAKRGSLIAKLGGNPYLPRTVSKFKRPCHDLAALATDLQKMIAAPTSLCGIKVEIGFPKCCRGFRHTPPGKLEPAYDIVLDRIQWRKLRVTIGDFWQLNKKCQAQALVKRILEDKCDELVEITFSANTDWAEPVIQEFFQGSSFPRLKTLELHGLVKFRLKIAKAIVSRAPKLEELHCAASVLLENLLEGSSAVFVPTSQFNPFEELPLTLVNAVRPRSLRLTTGNWDFNMDQFNEIIPVMLRNSWSTLNLIEMELFFVVPLMNYGISFVNMRSLTIFIPIDFYSNPPQPAVLECMKAFDFTRIFPNLSKVSFFSYDFCNIPTDEFVMQGRSILQDPKADKAVNIKHLFINGCAKPDTVKLLACMFPNIQAFEVAALYRGQIPYEHVWENWVNLKSLRVYLLVSTIKNLDSVFCGIHPDEVAELREQDENYLKAVNLVPSMPAITTMKELRTLDLTFVYFGRPTDQLFLSKVTQMAAFNRCPHLSVTIDVEGRDGKKLEANLY